MKPNLQEHPLRIEALIGQTSIDKVLRILTLLQSWSGWMSFLEISLEIYVPENAGRLQPLTDSFLCPVQIQDDQNGLIAASFHSKMNKPVFGIERQIIFNSLRLIEDDQTVFEAKRINKSALSSCIRKALKIQSSWLNDHISKFVDSKILD